VIEFQLQDIYHPFRAESRELCQPKEMIMKNSAFGKQALVMLFGLMVTQFACGLGTQPASVTPQTSLDNGSPSTQEPAPTKGERGTPDEAKAMLQLAIDHFNQVGREQAYADFNAGQPPFKDRDLYIVCVAQDHTETVNGGFPQYVGTSADSLTDVNGKPLGQAILDSVSASGQGETDYQWVNPVSGETEPKTLFAQKLGEDVCGVGAYNP
jgi:cytochrome c